MLTLYYSNFKTDINNLRQAFLIERHFTPGNTKANISDNPNTLFCADLSNPAETVFKDVTFQFQPS